MPSLRPRAMGVAPGGVQLGKAVKRHAILLSRPGAFYHFDLTDSKIDRPDVSKGDRYI